MSNHNSSFGLSLAPTAAGGWLLGWCWLVLAGANCCWLLAAALACEKLLPSSCPPVRSLLRSLKPRIFFFTVILPYNRKKNLVCLLSLLLLLVLEDNTKLLPSCA